MGSKCSIHAKAKAARERLKGKKNGPFEVPKLNQGNIDAEYKIGRPHGIKVNEVRNNITMQIFARYKLPKSHFPIKNGEEITKRIKLIQTIEHPNVCRLIEAFDDDGFIHLIYQNVGSQNITEEIVKSKKMSEQKAADIGRQIVRALNCALANNLVHGALVPKNILVQPAGGIVITDLGLVDVVKQDDIMKLNKDAFGFLSPEVLLPWYQVNMKDHAAKEGRKMCPLPVELRAQKTSACDIWSLGAILFFLTTGKRPFAGKNAIDIAEGVIKSDPEVRKAMKKVSKQAQELVESMLNKEPDKRPNAEDLLQHPWFMEKNKEAISNTPFDAEVFANMATLRHETHMKKFLMKMVANNLPPKKVKEIEKSFNKADLDGDGFISMDELKTFIEQSPEVSEFGLHADDAETIFAEVDRDKCGKISLHEFVIATVDSQQVLVESALRDAWKTLDQNKDGRISKKEMRNVVKEVEGRLGKAHIKELVNMIDSEVDGDLDFDQFCELATEEGKRAHRYRGSLCSRILKPCDVERDDGDD